MIATDDDAPNDLRYDIPRELSSLRTLLGQLEIVAVELHHFLDSDPRLVEALIALAGPFDVYIHDYSWICPRLTLIDGTHGYCGEPAIAVCESCIATNGSSLGESLTVAALRKRSARWLAAARQVVVPTGMSAGGWRDISRTQGRRWFRGSLISACRSRRRCSARRVRPVWRSSVPSASIRAMRFCSTAHATAAAASFPSNLSSLAIAKTTRPCSRPARPSSRARYREDEVADILRRESPDLVFFPGVAPETWCYALTHAMRSGLPIVGFDRGAVAERLRKFDRGLYFRLQLIRTVERIPT